MPIAGPIVDVDDLDYYDSDDEGDVSEDKVNPEDESATGSNIDGDTTSQSGVEKTDSSDKSDGKCWITFSSFL